MSNSGTEEKLAGQVQHEQIITVCRIAVFELLFYVNDLLIREIYCGCRAYGGGIRTVSSTSMVAWTGAAIGCFQHKVRDMRKVRKSKSV